MTTPCEKCTPAFRALGDASADLSNTQVSELVEAQRCIEKLTAEKLALEKELAEHKAARLAYASEFAPTVDGDPDVGNIHANIRALKQAVHAAPAPQCVPAGWISVGGDDADR